MSITIGSLSPNPSNAKKRLKGGNLKEIEIGSFAFSNLGKLEKIILGTNIGNIGMLAFNQARALTDVTSLSVTPPAVNDYAFDYNERNLTLHVLKGSKEVYESAEVWKRFKSIEEDAETTGVEPTKVAVGIANQYSINGQRSDGSRGIIIIRMSDGTIKKTVKR